MISNLPNHHHIYSSCCILGTTSKGEKVTGKIDIPELAHDTDPDDVVVSHSFLFIVRIDGIEQ